MTILTVTTGLTYETSFCADRLSDGLFVGNLRGTYVSLDLKLSEETVNDNVEVKLTHTGDDRLSCLLVCECTECRVFFSKFLKSHDHLLLGSSGLRLDSYFDNRLRELHGLEDDRMIIITERVTCCCVLQTNCSSDITGEYFGDLFSVVSVHLEDTSDTLFLTLCCIGNIRTCFQNAGVNTEEAKLTNERVSHDLERQCSERALIGSRTLFFLFSIRVNTLDCRNIQRGRHVVNDCIEHHLNTLISKRCTADDRDDVTSACSLTESCLQFVDGDLFSL